MMTLFSPEMKHAELEYYLNEKINPIAPHITDQGASTVATTIDQTFAKTLAQVALDLVSSLLKFAQSPQMSEYVSNATKHISSISSQLKSAASQADSYASLMGATGKIISSTDRLLGSTGSSASDAKKALKQGTAGVKSLDEALAGVSTSMSSSLSDAAGAYDTISKQVDTAFSDMGSQSSQITDKLTTLQRNIQSQADTFGTYAEALRSLADAAHLQAVKDALNNAAQQAQNTQNSLQKVADSIGDTSKKITDGTASADDTRKSLKKQIAAAKQSITDMANTYEHHDQAAARRTGQVDERCRQAVGERHRRTGRHRHQHVRPVRRHHRQPVRRAILVGRRGDHPERLGRETRLAQQAADGGRRRQRHTRSLADHVSRPRFDRHTAVRPGLGEPHRAVPGRQLWFRHDAVLYRAVDLGGRDHPRRHDEGVGVRPREGEGARPRRNAADGRDDGREGCRDRRTDRRAGAMLDVLRKPRPESPGNARRFGLHPYQEYFGDTPFSARWRCCRARWYAWATCFSSACSASIRCSS